jgi:tetratricopeptide (TPR) repeat protein
MLLLPVALMLSSSYFRGGKHRGQIPLEASPGSGSTASSEQLAQAQPTVQNRINLSQAYIKDARYGQAVALLRGTLAEDPNDVVAWNNLCVAHIFLKEFNLALDACKRGVQINESFQLVRNNLNWAEQERGKVVLALAEQEKTEPGQRDSSFYLEEGLNYLHLGAYEEAESAWRRVNKLDPRSSLAWNNLGTAEMMQHRYDTALQNFVKARALDPKSILIQNNIAWAQASIKNGHD